jgi:hypothetical protein
MLLFLVRYGCAIVAVHLQELSNVVQGAIDFFLSEKLAQLKLAGVDDLVGRGPVGSTVDSYIAHEVIGNHQERKLGFIVGGALGPNLDICEPSGFIDRLDTLAEELAVEGFPDLLLHQTIQAVLG